VLSIIVAVSSNMAIGKDSSIPWHVPDDFRWFKEVTIGKCIIMGKNTWDSLPLKPLPGRRNIVVSTDLERKFPGAERAFTIEEAISMADGDAFFVGGSMIYRHALKIADVMYMSKIPVYVDPPFVSFPDFSRSDWSEAEQIKRDGFSVVKLTRLKT
jgi:dihydrofolate reductase